MSEDVAALKSQIKTLEAAALEASKRNKQLLEEKAALDESVKSLNNVVTQLRTDLHSSNEKVIALEGNKKELEGKLVEHEEAAQVDEFIQRVRRMYAKYCPEKAYKIPMAVRKAVKAKKQEQLMQTLIKTYGPEPDPNEKLDMSKLNFKAPPESTTSGGSDKDLLSDKASIKTDQTDGSPLGGGGGRAASQGQLSQDDLTRQESSSAVLPPVLAQEAADNARKVTELNAQKMVDDARIEQLGRQLAEAQEAAKRMLGKKSTENEELAAKLTSKESELQTIQAELTKLKEEKVTPEAPKSTNGGNEAPAPVTGKDEGAAESPDKPTTSGENSTPSKSESKPQTEESSSSAAEVEALKKELETIKEQIKEKDEAVQLSLEAKKVEIENLQTNLKERETVVQEQAEKIGQLSTATGGDPAVAEELAAAVKEKDSLKAQLSESSEKSTTLERKLDKALQMVETERVQFEWHKEDLEKKVSMARQEADRLKSAAAKEVEEIHRQELIKWISFVQQSYKEVREQGPKPSMSELRDVLLKDKEQQKLVEDNRSLEDENFALRGMMDRLLGDFTDLNKASKELGDQLLSVQTQLGDERMRRDDLLKLKANDLEEVYAGMLLKKQDELDSMSIKYREAEKTLSSILPAVKAREQQKYGGGGHFAAGGPTNAVEIAMSTSMTRTMGGNGPLGYSPPRSQHGAAAAAGSGGGGYSPGRAPPPHHHYLSNQQSNISPAVKASLMADI